MNFKLFHDNILIEKDEDRTFNPYLHHDEGVVVLVSDDIKDVSKGDHIIFSQGREKEITLEGRVFYLLNKSFVILKKETSNEG